MAEKKPVPAQKKAAPSTESQPDPAAEMRSQLINRLVVATGLVASLLAILAFFDYLATPPDEAETAVYARPVPVTPKKEISQPVTPSTNLPEPPTPVAEVKADAKTEVPPAAPPAPEVSGSPSAPEGAGTKAEAAGRSKAQITKVDDSEAAPEKRLPVARSTAARTYALPVVPAISSRSTNLPTPRARLPETPSDITEPPTVNQEIRSPSARVVQVAPATSVLPPNVQRLFSGFLLQAGVFSSAQRAEELHAKLTLSGVPSTLETRVQVGPFRTRQEAEAAQEKLRELGIGSLLVAPKGSKH
jgi:DedD protein